MTLVPLGPSRRCLRSIPGCAPRVDSGSPSVTRSPLFSSTRRRPTTTEHAGTRQRLSSPRTRPMSGLPRAKHRSRACARRRPTRASRAATPHRRASGSVVRISPSSSLGPHPTGDQPPSPTTTNRSDVGPNCREVISPQFTDTHNNSTVRLAVRSGEAYRSARPRTHCGD